MADLRCRKHPEYSGERAPKEQECYGCWITWMNRHQAQAVNVGLLMNMLRLHDQARADMGRHSNND